MYNKVLELSLKPIPNNTVSAVDKMKTIQTKPKIKDKGGHLFFNKFRIKQLVTSGFYSLFIITNVQLLLTSSCIIHGRSYLESGVMLFIGIHEVHGKNLT